MARFLLSSLVLCLAAGIQAAALALPEPAFPEVIPGPGLPSLKELNLTSAQLHAMGPPNEVRLKVRALSARADPPRWFCGESNTSYDSVNKIITCVHFLLYLNDYECVASEGLRDVQVCRVDDAVITIYDKFNDDESYRRSSCADVAMSVLYTIDRCTRRDQTYAGWVPPWDDNGKHHLGIHAGNFLYTTLRRPKKTGTRSLGA